MSGFNSKLISLAAIFCLAALAVLSVPGMQQESSAERSPVTGQHVDTINGSFRQNGIVSGFAALDRYGRVELKGEYLDEREVDRAFSLAQLVVGVKWVSPVTPENIKVKEWEKRLSSLFSRARVITPSTPSDASPGPVRNRYALIVGVGQFLYGIQPLQYTVQDARSFYQFLTDPRRGGFSPHNVTFLADASATRANISGALDAIKRSAAEDDLVVIYFSTHGTPPDKFGGVHVVTYDTEVKPREKVWHTAITDVMLKDFVEGLRSKRLVMILDTCYSNGAYRNVPGFLPPGGKSLGADEDEGYGMSREYGKRVLGAKDIVLEATPSQKTPGSSKSFGEEEWGKVLVSASGPGEKSWESDTLRKSIFTHYFVDGLNRYQGSLQGAFYHAKPLVYQRVKQEKGRDIDQTPQVMATNPNWNMHLSSRKKTN